MAFRLLQKISSSANLRKVNNGVGSQFLTSFRFSTISHVPFSTGYLDQLMLPSSIQIRKPSERLEGHGRPLSEVLHLVDPILRFTESDIVVEQYKLLEYGNPTLDPPLVIRLTDRVLTYAKNLIRCKIPQNRIYDFGFWDRPPQGINKINCDGALVWDYDDKTGQLTHLCVFAFIIRNYLGEFVFALLCKQRVPDILSNRHDDDAPPLTLDHNLPVKLSVAAALDFGGYGCAHHICNPPYIIETDNMSVYEMTRKAKYCDSFMEEIKNKCLNSKSVIQACSRVNNMAASAFMEEAYWISIGEPMFYSDFSSLPRGVQESITKDEWSKVYYQSL